MNLDRAERPCGSRWRALRLGTALLIFGSAGSAFGQQGLPPAAEKQMAAGVEALKSGDLETAEKIFAEAARNGVKHSLVYHNLGVIAQQKADHLEAGAKFREGLALQPEYGPSHLLPGVSLLALGKDNKLGR